MVLSIDRIRITDASAVSMVGKINLAHMPPELAIYVAMYVDVENAAFLKEQLLASNSDFEYAFIDANMVSKRSSVATLDNLDSFTCIATGRFDKARTCSSFPCDE